MIEDLDVIALIPARGGSKGFPGKNLAPLGGRSLIDWAVSAAKGSRYIDRVVLSTDSAEIATEGRRAGAEVPFMRPDEPSTDLATSDAVVLHALNSLSFLRGLVVLLQPTSPLRTAADIDACLELAVRSSPQACVSVCEADKSPYWMFHLGPDGQLAPVVAASNQPKRRQDAPVAYLLNGAVYVFSAEDFIVSRSFAIDGVPAHIMPRERSIDIDLREDLELAERLLSRADS